MFNDYVFWAMLCIWTYVHLEGKILERILKRIRALNCIVHTYFTDWCNWSGHASQLWLIFQSSSDFSSVELSLRTIRLEQCLQKYNAHVNHLDILLKCRFWFCRYRLTLKVCISTKFLEDADVDVEFTACCVAGPEDMAAKTANSAKCHSFNHDYNVQSSFEPCKKETLQ